MIRTVSHRFYAISIHALREEGDSKPGEPPFT